MRIFFANNASDKWNAFRHFQQFTQVFSFLHTFGLYQLGTHFCVFGFTVQQNSTQVTLMWQTKRRKDSKRRENIWKKEAKTVTHSAFSPFNYLIRSVSHLITVLPDQSTVLDGLVSWEWNDKHFCGKMKCDGVDEPEIGARIGNFFSFFVVCRLSFTWLLGNWKSQCVSISNVCFVCACVRTCVCGRGDFSALFICMCVCIYFCTKFQLLNECNGILFGVYCSSVGFALGV